MDKNSGLYNSLAKKLIDYTDEPSKFKKERMLNSINGSLGAMKRNGYDKEAMALDELRKIFKRIK
jgi:hypothetical protein